MLRAEANEPVAGTPQSRVWRRASTSAPWAEVTLPDSGDVPWSPEGCIDGNLTISAPAAESGQQGDVATRRLVYDADDPTSWHVLADAATPAASPMGGPVHGLTTGPALHWFGGQVWRFDDATDAWTNLSVPADPFDTVRWSVPWRDDRLVVLVDASPTPSDEHQAMDLELHVVEVPSATA